MGSIKLTKFLGEAPKISPELLPDGAAQQSYNVKVSSGDLVPYRVPKLIAETGRTSTIKTLYKLTNPSNNNDVFLTWDDDIDIAIAAPPWTVTSTTEDTEQRFYYTDGVKPKVSNYDLATDGSAPYPVANGYYDLGLALPTTSPSISASSFSVSTSASYARDSGNTATFTAGSAHGLRTGNIVTIRDFGTSDEAKSFNAQNVEVTVTSATAFKYYSPGDQVSSTNNTSGKADLAGNTQIRTYVYTWMTPWDEESIPSLPSGEVYIKEGQAVTVSNLPSAKPSGDNFVRGVRLYRTVTSAVETQYFLLKTLWFPTSTATVSRVGSTNIATVKLAHPHNFIVGDRFKLKSSTADSGNFNVTGGTVASIVDKYTFTYSNSGGDVATTADTNGVVCHDVAESLDDTARYWGDSSYDFTDDFLLTGLTVVLPSEDYDPPPAGMKGLITAHNNMLVGFFDNQLCLAFPDKPHAWPEKHRLTFESDIVAISAMGGYIIILTTSYPYFIQGNSPATMVSQKIDTLYPCVSKRSVVNMNSRIIWATHGGLASFAPGVGIDLITKLVHDWDTWNDSLSPSTIVGHYYNGKYFGSHSTGSFIFEQDEKIGGHFVTIEATFTAACTDTSNNAMYYIGDVNLGDIYEWDNSTQTLTPMEWKSKAIITKDYMNMGAARVVADYDVTAQESANIVTFNNAVPTTNAAVWAVSQQLGTINGPTDYGSPRVENKGGLNSFELNGDGLTTYLKEDTGIQTVTFRVWADKSLIFQGAVSSSDIFRLPTGYRSDTFEVAVSGNARVRAIHIGETPYGLKAV